MKSISFLLVAFFAIISSSLFAQTAQTDTIKVYGNCGMCKSRIEKTVKVEGVSSALWNSETKFLIVSYDPGKITNDSLQQRIAAVGHDTEKYTADDKVYIRLPGCCHYERKKEPKKENPEQKQ